jgi:hypothetical protein
MPGIIRLIYKKGIMDWEKIGKLCYHFLMYLIEWGFKLCALVAGWFALVESGSFGLKIRTGFSSLSYGLRQLFKAPSEINKMIWFVRDYAHMGKGALRQTYGAHSVEQFMHTLNEGITFLYRILNNISQNPLSTLGAGLVVVGIFYLLARIIRFTRQRGQGSRIVRMERGLADRIFQTEEHQNKRTPSISERKAAKFTNSSRWTFKQLFSS